jgi:poly-gamma-glutamate synthesis protein (capsule biosynthesis protein)
MSRPNVDDAAAAEKDYFPYAFTPRTDLPRYARFRPEGRPASEYLRHPLLSLLKYRHKVRDAPPEEVAYFDRQRQLLRALAGEPPRPGGVRLALVGDLMWIRRGWSGFLADEVRDYLNRHDVVLGNLETVVSSRFHVPGLLPDSACFNSEPGLVTAFRRPDGRSTFTALSVANNHVTDCGHRGAQDLLRFLDEQGILHSGVRQHEDDPSHVTFAAGGITLGFHATTWGVNKPLDADSLRVNVTPGLLPEDERGPDLSGIRAALGAMADEGVDLRVVGLHWGFEYEYYPSPRQMQVAREIVRAGADLVVGGHPHVQQPAEVCFVNGYQDTCGGLVERLPAMSHPAGCVLDDGTGRPRKALVLYSLGNFTTAMFTFLCRVGLIQSLRLRRDPRTGQVDWACPHAKLVYGMGPSLSPRGRRLVFLGTFLREREARGTVPRKLRDDVAFLTSHLVAEV